MLEQRSSRVALPALTACCLWATMDTPPQRPGMAKDSGSGPQLAAMPGAHSCSVLREGRRTSPRPRQEAYQA